MSELSVNISQFERSQIMDKATELLYRTAKIRDPDPEFRTKVTKKIVKESLDRMRPMLDSPFYPYLHFIRNYEYAKFISNIQLEDELTILTLGSPESHNTLNKGLLRKITTLETMQYDELNIGPEFVVNGYTLCPFMRYNERTVEVSQSIKDEIEAYNEQMLMEFSALGTQLYTLLTTISDCKTTKAFYAKLPQNLTTLFPTSLKNKITTKNKKSDEPITEAEQALIDATTSIATASLIGE